MDELADTAAADRQPDPAACAEAPAPFLELAQGVRRQSPLRAAITEATLRPEPECVAALIEAARLPPEQARRAESLARRLARRLRERGTGVGREGLVQGLIQEFSLSSQEGVALMCLAEALLRIPDTATRDALIRDKLGRGDWHSHVGGSGSLFVNAATWGLIVTGRLVATHTESGLASALARAIAKSGEPLVRKGVDMAMRLLGEQFVAGETIDAALVRARRREAQGFRHSYDMLGEAALTDEDARRYLAAYEEAIHAIGTHAVDRAGGARRGVLEGPGISVKLSALHPRYSRSQHARTMQELYPRLLGLALLCRQHEVGLNLDAEEADRLELSLDLLEKLCFAAGLEGWNGLGFVVQAYQKRCPSVIDHLVDLARRSRRRLMVRLVKGAYWDGEIKRAQVAGLEGYPVYTRKVHTDLSFLACARKLLAFPREVFPQFATHNAHTLAAVMQAAGPDFEPGQYEFQCLHGMGEPLYEQVVRSEAEGGLGRPCRIYAPVGTHETLLAYLVRRLLENGANTSFVHRLADPAVAIDELVADPVALVEQAAAREGAPGLPHPKIPLPRDLYGEGRANSMGLDLSNEHRLATLSAELLRSAQRDWRAAPIVAGDERSAREGWPLRNPADRRDLVGRVAEASPEDLDEALHVAARALPTWSSVSARDRAAFLERAGELMQAQLGELAGLLVREAGRTLPNAIAEVREAIDFLRYYAQQLRLDPALDGAEPLGPVACISPWNFPLAIFTGQVAAALAAGNTVLAKPAEQTPLIAAETVRLLHAAGIPGEALQLLPGRGETVGAALVTDRRIRAVLFTGSTEVARGLQRSLAGRLDARGRPPTLVAETGGQNAMIVDSSALAEQAVADILSSAFDSAGQRCSALRVLFVQHEVADRLLAMLRGAMQALQLGSPDQLETDVGPVIDEDAKRALLAHVAAMRASGHRVFQPEHDRSSEAATAFGHFVPPTVIELADIGELEHEVFGPMLHVVRYARHELPRVLQRIDATGYGLTLGVQTRIDETVEFIVARARAGNQYVNRNMIGAVVGAQPFGGEGLSGTGPKAGGPLYLRRLVASTLPPRPDCAGPARPRERLLPLRALQAWLSGSNDPALAELAGLCEALARASPVGLEELLPGPTGERNTWRLLPRQAILAVAADELDRLYQLAHVLAADGRALWLDEPAARVLHGRLPAEARARVRLVADDESQPFELALVHGEPGLVRRWSERLAHRDGPIVTLHACPAGERGLGTLSIESLLVERSLSVNTAAAGGNASLMSVG